VRRRNVALFVALLLVVFSVQWGVRWASTESDPWRCQITVESWEAAAPNPYRDQDLPADQRHIGGIYAGDSGCTDSERCYRRSAGPFTTSLEPCRSVGADEAG
jgi:hypothetical protein